MLDKVMDIRTVETGYKEPCLPDIELQGDVLSCNDVRAGGQRNHWHKGEGVSYHGKPEIFGPEVMSPLGYAVRLIYGKEGDVKGLQNWRKPAAKSLSGAI